MLWNHIVLTKNVIENNEAGNDGVPMLKYIIFGSEEICSKTDVCIQLGWQNYVKVFE